MRLTPDTQASRVKKFDMTPMIDVVLQLIIFFMFTAQFGELARTEIPLPAEQGQEPDRSPAPPTFVIDITAQGEIMIDRRAVSIGELDRMIASEIARAPAGEPVSVRLRPDRSARAAHVNAVTRRLAALGVRDWSMATLPDGSATR